MNHAMEVFSTTYITYLCFAPYLIVLCLLAYRFVSSLSSGNGSDALIFLTLGVFLMLTYGQVEPIRKDSFVQTRMKQLDGVETYAETLKRTGADW